MNLFNQKKNNENKQEEVESADKSQAKINLNSDKNGLPSSDRTT